MPRLNKYLSEAGVCSRREADRLIQAGKVTVDGRKAVPGMQVEPGQVVKVGKRRSGRKTARLCWQSISRQGSCVPKTAEKKRILSVTWTIRSG